MTGEPRCERCFLKRAVCVCDDVPRVDNAVHVVIVRHNLEAHKASNTARLAAMSLARCELHDYGAPGLPFDDAPLRAPGAHLVFPEGPALAGPPSPLPERLIVLDGNWNQARRMRQRIGALRGVPLLSLAPPPVAPDRLRSQPLSEGMATIEAIARALALLGDDAAAAALDALYATFVERSLLTARYSPRRTGRGE